MNTILRKNQLLYISIIINVIRVFPVLIRYRRAIDRKDSKYSVYIQVIRDPFSYVFHSVSDYFFDLSSLTGLSSPKNSHQDPLALLSSAYRQGSSSVSYP